MAKLNRFQMAAVKRTAQNTKKLVTKRNKINQQMRELAAELIEVNAAIDAWESPIKLIANGLTSEEVLACNGEIPENVEVENPQLEN